MMSRVPVGRLGEWHDPNWNRKWWKKMCLGLDILHTGISGMAIGSCTASCGVARAKLDRSCLREEQRSLGHGAMDGRPTLQP